MGRGSVFGRVPYYSPKRSVFDLSYAKKFSGRMGYLYPVLHDEMVPGDVFDIGAEAVVRFAPMVAPVLHEIVLKADWFFVPYRILSNTTIGNVDGKTDFERFITGGQDGTEYSRTTLQVLDLTTPVPEGGLWDHLGVPPGVTLAVSKGEDSPLQFPGMAYLSIWNDYYRDPNFEDPSNFSAGINSNYQLKYSNWDADYFTRAMASQQRGTAPAFPISGIAHAVWDDDNFVQGAAAATIGPGAGAGNNDWYANTAEGVANLKSALNANDVDLGAVGNLFDVSELRFAVQLQRMLERNQRAGYRYTEWLKANFGVSPTDERLDRPEYIGGMRQNIVVSEVLQTSKTESGAPQGNLAGHGVVAGYHGIGRYHAKEYGIIMCIMSVQPRPAYSQGIDRQWLRKTRYDFYNPLFANLSEQAIMNEEIYLRPTVAENVGVWGYQGRYDEMRYKKDMIAGAFRSTLDYWHLGRKFGSMPALGATFGHVDPTTVTRIFAVPSADHLYVHWGNKIRAIRPLPLQGEPGLMDH